MYRLAKMENVLLILNVIVSLKNLCRCFFFLHLFFSFEIKFCFFKAIIHLLGDILNKMSSILFFFFFLYDASIFMLSLISKTTRKIKTVCCALRYILSLFRQNQLNFYHPHSTQYKTSTTISFASSNIILFFIFFIFSIFNFKNKFFSQRIVCLFVCLCAKVFPNIIIIICERRGNIIM